MNMKYIHYMIRESRGVGESGVYMMVWSQKICKQIHNIMKNNERENHEELQS